jgi:hypothetical protein
MTHIRTNTLLSSTGHFHYRDAFLFVIDIQPLDSVQKSLLFSRKE